jgi:hypothetical protein
VLLLSTKQETNRPSAYHCCLSDDDNDDDDDDDDEMMVINCVCQVDKDENNENEGLEQGCVKPDGSVVSQMKRFQKHNSHILLYRLYLSCYGETAYADPKYK